LTLLVTNLPRLLRSQQTSCSVSLNTPSTTVLMHSSLTSCWRWVFPSTPEM